MKNSSYIYINKSNKMILILNADYMPINVVSFKRGYKLVYKKKAEIVATDDLPIITDNASYDRPSVIRLVKYANIPYKKVVLTRHNVFKRDNFTCAYCNSTKNLTIDHVMPRSRGGKNTWENLVTCCNSCNVKKGDKTPEEIGFKLNIKPYIPSHIIFMFKANKPKENWKPFIFG